MTTEQKLLRLALAALDKSARDGIGPLKDDIRARLAQPEPDPWLSAHEPTCPPCNQHCNQGRTCPNRER